MCQAGLLELRSSKCPMALRENSKEKLTGEKKVLIYKPLQVGLNKGCPDPASHHVCSNLQSYPGCHRAPLKSPSRVEPSLWLRMVLSFFCLFFPQECGTQLRSHRAPVSQSQDPTGSGSLVSCSSLQPLQTQKLPQHQGVTTGCIYFSRAWLHLDSAFEEETLYPI